jgi:pimeloyl-ACP methyl ester carboxylesterase
MLALLKTLHQEAPIGRLSWVGTSMGGLIGMVLFGTPDLPVPAPLHRLVLNDIGPVTQWASIRRIQGYIGQAVHFQDEATAARDLWAVSATFGPHTPEQWLALTKPQLRPLPPEQGGGFTMHYDPAIAVPLCEVTEQSLRETEPVAWALYDHITAPTLLLRGAESDLLSPDTARAMSERGPHARVVEFAGVGHAPTLVAPEQVEVVTNFLLAKD